LLFPAAVEGASLPEEVTEAEAVPGGTTWLPLWLRLGLRLGLMLWLGLMLCSAVDASITGPPKLDESDIYLLLCTALHYTTLLCTTLIEKQ
jgi:hypothetical protein